MPSELLKRMKASIDAKRAEVTEKKQDYETKKKAVVDDAGDAALDVNSDAFKAVNAAAKPFNTAAEELADLEARFQEVAIAEGDGSSKSLQPDDQDPERLAHNARRFAESLGFKAVHSEAYTELKEQGAFSDGSKRSVGNSMLVEGDRDELVARTSGGLQAALLTGQTASGAAVKDAPLRIPGIDRLPQLPLGLFDLITVGQTDAPSVEFMRMVSRTIAAAEVHEAESTAEIGDGTGGTTTATLGGLKPESSLVFEKVTEGVKTIAHTLPATRNELDDAAGLQTTIDGEMRDGVDRRAEIQVLQGNGSGDNVRGVLNTTGIAHYDRLVDEPRVDALHKILTLLRLSGFVPSAFAMNPLDWEEVRLEKDANGNYLYGPPSQAGVEQVWGVPVAQTIGAAQDQPVAGEWRRAEWRWRSGTNVLVTDSHKDWFARNILMLLAEARGVLVIRRPQAFGDVDMTP